jgi:hypothetical protein
VVLYPLQEESKACRRRSRSDGVSNQREERETALQAPGWHYTRGMQAAASPGRAAIAGHQDHAGQFRCMWEFLEMKCGNGGAAA